MRRERALTAEASRMLPNFLGPEGVVRAPIPMDERSFVVAVRDAVRTAVLRRAFRDDDVDDDDVDWGWRGWEL